MTDERIAELRDLCAETSIPELWAENDGPDGWITLHWSDGAPVTHGPDLRFPAEARNALPELLDALEAERAKVKRLRAALKPYAPVDFLALEVYKETE